MASWFSAGDATYEPAPYPNAVSYPAHVVADGLLWILGGWGPGWSVETAVRTFDPIANTWTARTSMGASPWFDGQAAAHVGRTVYLQGNNGFYSYDLDTGAWATLTDPPGGNASQQDLAAVGGLVYNKLVDTTNACVYNPATDSWSSITPWPTRVAEGGFGHGMSVTVGNLIYVYWQGFLASYDPATDSWTDLATHDAARAVEHTNIVHVDGVLHLIGGESVATGAEAAFHSTYTIATDTWAVETSLPTARYGPAVGVIDDRIFVVGGEDGSGLLDEHDAWADTPPAAPVSATLGVTLDTASQASLAVTLDVGWDPEVVLPVHLSTDSSDAANAVLKVAMNTGVTPSATLAVHVGTANPAGETLSPTGGTEVHGNLGGEPAAGAEITNVTFTGVDSECAADQATGTVREAFGQGRVGEVEVVGTVDLTGVDSVRLRHTTASIDGTVREYDATYQLEANPYGMSWRREAGIPMSSVVTRDVLDVLADTVLDELVPAPADQQSIDDASLYNLDQLLDCASSDAETAADSIGSTLPARLDLARQAAAEAGFSIVVLGNVPNMDEPVDEDYRTEDRTAREVVADLLEDANPRTWARGRTVWIDARDLAATGGSSSVATFIDACDAAADSVSWRDEAPDDPGPEPVLAEYLEECSIDAGSGGTFETFDDDTYSWWEANGAGDDYADVLHNITKADGHVTHESEVERSYYRGDILDRVFGPTTRTERWHTYHSCCPDALVRTTETITQRKTIEDLQHFTSILDDEDAITEDDTGYSPYGDVLPTTTTEEAIWDAIPSWYTQKRTRVYQSWHAEGWLKTRTEVTREFDGMLAIPQAGGGPNPSYDVSLLYKDARRQQTYIPVGNGLWRIHTTVRTTQQRPIYEPVNPDAVEGDEDYGEVELTDVRSVRVSNNYTEITDQSPPSVSCDDEDCETRRTREWTLDHAVWTARQQLGRAKRVWTFTSRHLLPSLTVGDLVGGGIVASVSHTVSPTEKGSDVTIWEFLE